MNLVVKKKLVVIEGVGKVRVAVEKVGVMKGKILSWWWLSKLS